ncbi:hypothetical protein CRYO30217_02621 [Parvicella tangerina]|uniref:Uncharacterized protein n=2 Tax=Parvicella tangerina TaxID=2829795 RepID=A0A916NT08_9FLAO|nr:hypothetical protein CRYO30217_02621 [Parvicella tangerina]
MVSLLLFAYGFLWLVSFFFILTKERYINRFLQILHTCYFVLFIQMRYEWQEFPVLFIGVELVTAVYFTYRFLKVYEKEEVPAMIAHLQPKVRRNIEQFQKTVDQVFADNKEREENKKKTDLGISDRTKLDTNPQNQ